MRHALRHLPAYLSLLVPLCVLGWIGSAELSRQEERAEKALSDHEFAFLNDASRRLEEYIDSRSRLLLEQLPDLRARGLWQATRILVEEDPRIFDLIVLDEQGEMVFPTVSPPFEDGLPFAAQSSLREVDQAETLEVLGDDEGARLLLEAAIRTGNRGNGRENGLMRAHFDLAGLLRKCGDLDGAEEHYVLASAQAHLERRRPAAGAPVAPVALLCEVALAELDVLRHHSLARLLELLRDIADGAHDDVADPLLEQLVAHLAAQIPKTSELFPAAEEALRTDRVRRAGRRFAAEYGSFLRETLGRRLRQPVDGDTVFQVYNSPAVSSLLVLRPIAETQREASLEWLGAAAWIGLRLNLDLLLTEAVGDCLVPDAEGFYLTIADPDGETVLSIDAPGAADDPAIPRASRRSIAGLQLRAVPVDAEAYLESRRATFRNRALLVLALCVLAGAGAFFLVRAVTREAEVAALKVDLVSRVSHDLKTPLALIKMYSETLALGRTKSREQIDRFAGVISRESDNLTRMIERILDFSKQEAGGFAYDRTSTDLGQLLATVTDAYRPHLEAHGVALGTDLAQDLTAEVDRGAMESAVVNLLENAVKYTPSDCDDRRVVVRLHPDGEDAVLEVEDRGIGIPEREQVQVFQSFFRASNAGESRGAGLGLSLVKHFADAHGGSVGAAPRPGGGTIIRLTLPREREQRHARP